ncbi:MAG: uracil-DNA glycosylase [Mariprofundaceae bacterium]|nr:uracil-DNA glycosylase [Mariprofundaceae bacterium]
MNEHLNIEASWKHVLSDAFKKSSMHDLRVFLCQRQQEGAKIYPPNHDFFSAFNITPFEQVKVVILGQDPYHGESQAHGLCFSVAPHVPLPPSLRNIFKELSDDLHIPIPEHGCLTHWARQGVLLLNSVLTVEKGKANAHQGQGWETFTDDVIAVLNEKKEHLVFILWGAYAQKKASFVDENKHLIIKAPHPSPLSSYRGFFGQHYFSRINEDLQEHGMAAIDWQLPPLEEAKQQFQSIEKMNQTVLHD